MVVQFVLAAGHGEYGPTVPFDSLGYGLVGSRVAGVEAENNVGRRVGLEIDDPADLEVKLRPPQRVAQAARLAILGAVPEAIEPVFGRCFTELI